MQYPNLSTDQLLGIFNMLLSRVCRRYTDTSSTYMYMWVPSTGCQIVFLAYPSDQVLIVSY